MNGTEADRFLPEHLAKWLELAREYLGIQVESSGPSSNPGTVSLLPDGNRSSPDTASPVVQRAEMADETLLHPVSQVGSSKSVLLSWAYRALLHLLRRATRHQENPLAALETAFHFHVSFLAKHPSVPLMILAWHSQTGDARVRSRIQGAIAHYESRLARLIGKAKRQGLVMSTINAQAAAGAFVGMIQGLALRMRVDLGRPELLLREAAAEFPVYLDGIRNTSASERGIVFNRAHF